MIDSTTCDENEEDTFSLTRGAFRFSGQTDGSSVTFHVTAVVCLDDGSLTQCVSQCNDCYDNGVRKRKRRETVEDSLETKYYLKSGPYIFKDIKKGLYLC